MSAQKLQAAAAKMADALKIRRKFAEQAKERGETEVTLHVGELWEGFEESALSAYETCVREAGEDQPLFLPDELE